MGLLSNGTPLNWPDALQHIKYVKKHGIIQFLKLYAACKDRVNEEFLWGDEVESLLVVFDAKQRRVRLCLRAPEVLAKLTEYVEELKKKNIVFHANFLPEYGAFMVEATPGRPYGGTTADLRMVEVNMRLRRRMVAHMLRANESQLTLGAFPLLGVGDFCEPFKPPPGPHSQSEFLPDHIISPHPRFATLTANIRQRRGSKVDIRLPLFQDEKTSELKETDIHMDAMGFGMGNCCLQVTFQARTMREARQLYDQLAILSPLLLAVTAATPFFKGRIADVDVRWSCISQAVDDRTPVERTPPSSTTATIATSSAPAPSAAAAAASADAKQSPKFYINKSRYDSIDSYLSLESALKPEYNDIKLIYDQESYDTMRSAGVDELLAKHIAHLWIRDPLVVYKEHIEIDDDEHSDHFENLQSTNWQTVRFKPPPPNSTMGWRVEFRTMEIQFTDFENAAFTVFVALLSRAILLFNLNFYIPISQVDQNLKRAHANNAAMSQKFFMRENIKNCGADEKAEIGELSMQEIMCGKKPNFPGLIPIVRSYLDVIKCDKLTRDVVEDYLGLIEARATGQLMTAAQWMRLFVHRHPDYQHNSVINDSVTYDLLHAVDAIAHGRVQVPQLLGKFGSKVVSPTAPSLVPASPVASPVSADATVASLSPLPPAHATAHTNGVVHSALVVSTPPSAAPAAATAVATAAAASSDAHIPPALATDSISLADAGLNVAVITDDSKDPLLSQLEQIEADAGLSAASPQGVKLASTFSLDLQKPDCASLFQLLTRHLK